MGIFYGVSGTYRSTCTQTYVCAYNLTQQVQVFRYNKTCLKRPPKNSKKIVKIKRRKKKRWSSWQMTESIAECSLWNILQYFWPALSNIWFWKPSFGLLFEWPLKTGFTVFNLSLEENVAKVFSCVSWGLILALWNALNLFSVTGLHPWPIQAEYHQTPQDCILYKMPQ